ncbi:MAG: hypothetical protein IT582_05995 [Opitutaceae bacterium]|nr:hypothetical protein [Opitutaceae bacterium]
MQKCLGESFPEKSKVTLKLIGMGIEFRFQQEFCPEINVLTKRRQGGFKAVNFVGSKSIQATIAREWIKDSVFDVLFASWNELQAEAARCAATSLVTPFGSIVFPGKIFDLE